MLLVLVIGHLTSDDEEGLTVFAAAAHRCLMVGVRVIWKILVSMMGN